jgi:hypothetical protein
MNETLRPSTLGEILDRTVQLYRGNFGLFAGTAALPLAFALVLAVPAVAIFAIPGIPGAGSMQNNVIAAAIFSLAFLVAAPIYLAVYVFAVAGLTQAAVSAYRGEKLTIRAALKSVRPRFWTYLWYLFLQAIMAGFVPVIVAGVIIGPLLYVTFQPDVGPDGSILLGFVAIVLGVTTVGVIVWLALGYAMGMAVCVVEKKTAWESLQRAAQLSKGTRGRIFVLFLLVMVLSMIVSMVGYFFAVVIGAMAGLMGSSSTVVVVVAIVGAILYMVISIGGQIILQPVSWIALVLFYYDQRIRKEGFDIEWMMQQAGMGLAEPSPARGTLGIISAPATPPDTVEGR